MKASEKQTVMDAFKEGHLHLLVATTVIEGVWMFRMPV